MFNRRRRFGVRVALALCCTASLNRMLPYHPSYYWSLALLHASAGPVSSIPCP